MYKKKKNKTYNSFKKSKNQRDKEGKDDVKDYQVYKNSGHLYKRPCHTLKTF